MYANYRASFQHIISSKVRNSDDGIINEVYDPIRKSWVDAQPEELVRQALIHYMCFYLDFPLSLICVEKALDTLPHIQLRGKTSLPLRRLDLLVYTNQTHISGDLHPLLMIECKAIPLDRNVFDQVIGYNQYVESHFVAIVNKNEIHTGWFDTQLQNYRFVQGLPKFAELIDAVNKVSR